MSRARVAWKVGLILMVAAGMGRALALDESFGEGAVHEFFIAFDGGRPAAAGGSEQRARAHFERALALGGGNHAAPFVSLAETVSVGAQDRAGLLETNNAFHEHLKRRGVPHRYLVFEGGHRWSDWNRIFPVILCKHLAGTRPCELAADPFYVLEEIR